MSKQMDKSNTWYSEIYEFKSFRMLNQVVITAMHHERNPDLMWVLQKVVTFWLSPMELQKKKFAANLNFRSKILWTANDDNYPCYLPSENYYQHMSFIRGKIRCINIYVVLFVHNNIRICITLVCCILAANETGMTNMANILHTYFGARYVLICFTLILFEILK